MRRTLIAIIIGLLGMVFINVATPYNNFVLGNANISDDYMPTAAVFVVLILVLGVNPLLRRVKPEWMLTRLQLALVFGMLLVASVPPSQGLNKQLPNSIAYSTAQQSLDARLAQVYQDVDPPPQLFIDELGHGSPTPNADAYLNELGEGESVPWHAWFAPTVAWGGLVLPWWIMMVALAVILLPQWRDGERQPFPLIAIQQELVGVPDADGSIPPIFTNRPFWFGAGAVFFLHFLYGAQQYWPQYVPAIPLSWNLGALFDQDPIRHLGYWIRRGRIFFIFMGIGFFMRNRVAFSVWFFQLVFGVFMMVKIFYAPPFQWYMIYNQRIGAFLVLPIGVLWLGRRHWGRVFRCMAGRTENESDVRYQVAGWAFAAGVVGMLAWLLWVGVNVFWAIGLVTLAVFFAVAITRVVAETGLPLIAPDSYYTTTLAKLVPMAWRTAASSYFSGIIGYLIGHGNRLCVTTLAIHGLGLDAKSRPRKQIGLAGLFVGVMVLAALVSGATYLFAFYHNSMRPDGTVIASSWIFRYFRYGEDLVKGIGRPVPTNQIAWLVYGIVLATVCMVMCQVSPRWPFHPVALLFVGNWYADKVWISVFFGWLCRSLITRYGGYSGYKAAKPVFIGLIMGEVSAMMFWSLFTAVRACLGMEYEIVSILPF